MPDLLHQNELTEACSIPRANLAQTVVGMAHFAGTGPFDATCGDCVFWLVPPGRKKAICDKYRQMTKDGAKPVPSASPACRYYQRKPSA